MPKSNIPLPGGASKARPITNHGHRQYHPSKLETLVALSTVGLVALLGLGGIIEGVTAKKEGRIAPTEIPNPCLTGPTESLAHPGDIEPTFFHPGSPARVEFTDPDTIKVVDSTGNEFTLDLVSPQPQVLHFKEDPGIFLARDTETITVTLLPFPGTFQVEHSCPGKETQ